MSTQQLTSNRIEFDDAASAIEFYFQQGWTDGLPVVPPTVERVAEFIGYVGRSPSEIVCTEPTKGRVITLEKVAINAVMAGCLPEYFPVVLAAVEAMSEPQFNLHAITALTSNRIEFDDAASAIEFYFQQGWTDGLPVVPPYR